MILKLSFCWRAGGETCCLITQLPGSTFSSANKPTLVSWWCSMFIHVFYPRAHWDLHTETWHVRAVFGRHPSSSVVSNGRAQADCQQTNMLNIKEKSHFTSACARHFLFQLISRGSCKIACAWCFHFFRVKSKPGDLPLMQRTHAGGWLTATTGD